MGIDFVVDFSFLTSFQLINLQLGLSLAVARCNFHFLSLPLYRLGEKKLKKATKKKVRFGYCKCYLYSIFVSSFPLLLRHIFISFTSLILVHVWLIFASGFLDHQCLRPPYGVVFLATKRTYVGFNSTTRHLRTLMDEEGIFGAHLVKEVADREIWKFFVKWIRKGHKNITETGKWSNI